eukprot:XP_001707452.1 Hypothetical protein GL50803_39159 [Giardia lamblia ATCC 50803]
MRCASRQPLSDQSYMGASQYGPYVRNITTAAVAIYKKWAISE